MVRGGDFCERAVGFVSHLQPDGINEFLIRSVRRHCAFSSRTTRSISPPMEEAINRIEF